MVRNCFDFCYKFMLKNRIWDFVLVWKIVFFFKLLWVKFVVNICFLKNGFDMVLNYIIFIRKGKVYLLLELGSGILCISFVGVVIIVKLFFGLIKLFSNILIFLGWSLKILFWRKICIEEFFIISVCIFCNVVFLNFLVNIILVIVKVFFCIRYG